MRSFSTKHVVQFGDCDPAGIVYYPNYYRWMDDAFHGLTLSIGFDQRRLIDGHGILGTPLVDTGCTFVSSATYGDNLTVDVHLEAIKTTSVRLSYRFARGTDPVAFGHEVRVFVRRAATGLEKAEIPDDVRVAFTAVLTKPTETAA